MRIVQSLALLTLILAGGIAAPARAQSLELNGRRLNMTSGEQKALGDVRGVMPNRNRAVQDKALEAARRVVQSPDARHVLAVYRLEIANQRGDNAMRIESLDLLIASDLTSADSLASYLGVRGGIAFQAGDIATAKTHWTRLAAMKPDDPQLLANLAQVRIAENDPAGAIDLIQRAVARQTATGKPVPEGLYRQWLSVANQAKLAPPGFAAAIALVRAWPSAQNWRDALVVYRQLSQPQGGMEIDLLRLMRAVGALTRPAEYQRLAQLLNAGGMAAEARKVIDEGEARDVIPALDLLTRQIGTEIDREMPKERSRADQGEAGADSLAGMGRYDAAIALYRAAPGAEAQLHLGMALVLAGRKGEAEAVFRALAARPGGHGELASFWLAWLEQAKG